MGAEYLIPFKMFAWIDLRNRKQLGEHVNERDLKKHKYDVFRLLQIVSDDKTIATSGVVRSSIEQFVNLMEKENLPLAQLGIPFDKEEGISILHKVYGI